ncbi:uncharacterized protein LOC121962654 [Plectropomus leopardus]|uniref:uncharacterized protein LOC121962654 n=1 Tax=Plectropomus leopardus TaxID=160734 RepID=UPI001C4C8B60|nr:uncharacterized protein LOC121962654 [Plectropomus leopardus]
MIEHCQQILGEEPSSLFGGPPQRLNTDEMGSDSWLYPLTDSSYDSLENELDNSSGGSPGFCSRRHLRPKALRGSLDSVLTGSDYDQDTDQENHPTQTDSPQALSLHPLRRSRGRRQDADVSCSAQDPPAVDTSSTPDSLSPDGRRRQRRRSEPAIAYAAKLRPCTSGNTDGVSAEEEDCEDELPKKPSSRTLAHCRGHSRRGDAVRSAVEVSSPSLSSTPTSPAPTRSSLDSLDSLSSDHTWATGRRLHPAKTQPPSCSPPLSVPSAPFTISSALTPAGPPEPAPKDSPPKDALNWGTLKGCRGLHPNSWLKKGRRLSLTQQDNLEKEDDDKTAGGAADKSLSLGKAGERGGRKVSSSQPKTPSRASKEAAGGRRPGQEHSKPRHLKPESSSPPSHHRSAGSLLFPKSDSPLTMKQLNITATGSDISSSSCAAQSEVAELTQPSLPVFYKQSGPPLSLFRQHKSHSVEEGCNAKLSKRRGSEPGRQVVERASALTRARLPSDPGLKVSEAESQGATPEARFCLSPCAAKAVKDYFSSHPRSSPQSSQQVALALVESRREWLKRCCDPSAEPDFDQLLFAEESYV